MFPLSVVLMQVFGRTAYQPKGRRIGLGLVSDLPAMAPASHLSPLNEAIYSQWST